VAARRSNERLPAAVVVVAVLGVAFIAVPLAVLLQRVPWSDLGTILRRPVVLDALRLSTLTALAATALSLLLGLPLAVVLARGRFRGRRAVRALVTLPMVLPPVVGGTALLFALGRRGTLGEPLFEATGFLLPYSTWGVVVANTFVAMPFLVLTIESGLRGADARYEDAAATLGATWWTTFARVTLPNASPSIVAGAVLCWARALGEFGATVTFAGNREGVTQTMPLAIYLANESDRAVALALSLVMVVVSAGLLLLLRDRWIAPAP
jgi:molybdate transport system permease protein